MTDYAPGKGPRIVLTVHGIRTYGDWQRRLEKLARNRFGPLSSDSEVYYLHYTYGFFTLFSFLIPFLRNLAVRKFRSHLESVFDELNPGRVDIVAHSFGTYLAIVA